LFQSLVELKKTFVLRISAPTSTQNAKRKRILPFKPPKNMIDNLKGMINKKTVFV